ncbi:MAG: protein-methionine-sulfoxide reductase catalytic subunit MsrP [endosymbiont of Galathealinum brachiosum]|uniref:Protein-methionine-sulfoxide reductase catalytic subunit MsrP n=1 Tax=endosymbiont of Galathealinum brachiosum TaxID=2200906 RepID=A0A370DMJ0_9GAMM|nr:MAG: protein-methionine-sulfoxide reductase catalytic subunit MsrP [endosymbiont of Galathealinum brachiosum]
MSIIIKSASKQDIKSSEITTETDYLNRRDFIKKSGILVSAAWAGGLSLPASAKSSDYGNDYPGLKKTAYGKGENLTSFKDATTYNNYYEFGTGKKDPAKKAVNFKTDPWSITVEGEASKTGTFHLEDILKHAQVEERIYRFRCVEAWSMTVPWVGFSLADMLKRFEPTSKAKYVQFETLYDPKQMPGQVRRVLDWPYRDGLRIDEAMNPLCFMATGIYGRDMPNQNGAPIRLVVPWKYGFKNIKSIVKIKFMEHEPVCTWNVTGPKEYGFYSNVNPDVDHPRWSQATERALGSNFWEPKTKTRLFNGYGEQVAHLYKDMDLTKYF